jgi:hypothetical protein
MELRRPPIQINLLGRRPQPQRWPRVAKLRSITGLWHWSTKWGWYDVLFVSGAGIMPPLGEYAFSIFFLFLAAFSLTSRVWHGNHRILRKALGTGGIVVTFFLFAFIIRANKGKQPWSHLSSPVERVVRMVFQNTPAPPSFSSVQKPPPCYDQEPDYCMSEPPKRITGVVKPETPTPTDVCNSEIADCTEDARGYLKTWAIKVWLDHWDVRVDTLTSNTGKLVVFPRALIIEHIEVHAPLTPQEEDEFFSKFGFGGGQAGVQWPTENYWAPSDPPHLTHVIGPIPETSEDPSHPQIINNINGFKGGNTAAYVFTRAFFRDKLGWVISESCTWYQEPDLSQPHLCSGHNGPGKYPHN